MFGDKKYLDLWSVSHLLAGGALGALSSVADKRWWLTASPSLALLSGWEVFEAVRGVEEEPPNRLLDVVVGAAGWAAAYPLKRFARPWRLVSAAALGAAALGFSLWGRSEEPEATPL